jgi:hypothetical protein
MKRANPFLGANSIDIRSGYSLSEGLLSRYINYCITFFNPFISTGKFVVDLYRITKKYGLFNPLYLIHTFYYVKKVIMLLFSGEPI